MLIDSHQHVFWHGRDDADLIADLDQHGIDLAWLLTWNIPEHPRYEDTFGWGAVLNPAHVREDGSHPGIPLSDLLIAHRRYPGRFLLGYCPDPAMPGAPALFEAACKVHGVRICGEWKFRMPFDDPRCLELFRKAGELHAPVVLHLDVPYLKDEQGQSAYIKSWYGGTVENLERALIACPQTNFIGHAPGFWREISGDAGSAGMSYPGGPVTPGGKVPALLERYPNLYADLSAGSALRALSRDSRHAREFLIRFSDKLLFARDYFGGQLLDFLRGLDLPAEAQRKIFEENARRLVPPEAPKAAATTLKLA